MSFEVDDTNALWSMRTSGMHEFRLIPGIICDCCHETVQTIHVHSWIYNGYLAGHCCARCHQEIKKILQRVEMTLNGV